MSNAATNKLSYAYLIVGEDALKRRTVIDRLKKRLESMGDLEFNYDQFSGETCTGNDVVAACNTLPFASEMRLVELRDVEKLAKDDSEALVSYLSNPCDTTVLALIGEKLAKNTRLYKAVAALGAKSIIDCAPMKRQDLPSAVRSMAVSHGFTISAGGASKLIELIGEDTVALDSELKKLALAHAGNQAVGEREVESLVARVSEAKPWEFVDAFAARNIKECVRIRKILGSTSPYALLGMCTQRIRELMCAKSLSARGQASNLASTLGVPPWRVKKHGMWASKFSARELEEALVSARNAERAMKSGSDPELAFMDWVFLVCRAKA